METLWQDLRYGARQLARNPGFTAVAVLTLALGIGANTAIFSVANSVLLERLPFRQSDRLVLIWGTSHTHGQLRDVISGSNFLDFQRQNTTLEGLAAFEATGMTTLGDEGSSRVPRLEVTPEFFNVLGLDPVLGRAFVPEDGLLGQEKVALLGYGYWQQRFGADPDIVGKTLAPIGQPHVIVGVLPPGFRFFQQPDVVTPLVPSVLEHQKRTYYHYWAIGRLKPGVSVAQAEADLGGILNRIADEHPSLRAWEVAVDPLAGALVESVRPALLWLLAAVGLVLLIACVNVANLLLVRGMARRSELAMRAALGAAPGRLIRQLLTEGLLIALAGGVLGFLLAVWGAEGLRGVLPSFVSIPGSAAMVALAPIQMDARVFAFAAAISVLTVAVFGLLSAWPVVRVDVRENLHSTGRHGTPPHAQRRTGDLLVVFELALATLLLVASGLMVRTIHGLYRVDTGFRTENILTMYVGALHERGLPERAVYYDQVLEAVAAVPGVKAAAFNDYVPLQNEDDYEGFTIESRPEPEPGQYPREEWRRVTPGYFEAVDVQLVRGRAFADADTAETHSVVVINEAMARKYWPGENPVGQRIDVHHKAYGSSEIIGLVRDERFVDLNQPPKPLFYVPYQRSPRPQMALFVRMEGDAASALVGVKRAVWSVDRTQPIFDVNPMEALLADSIAVQRLTLLICGLLAGLALALASVGVYGVVSYSVSRRTNEIGIRMALGAGRRHIFGLVLGQGLRLAAAGVAAGLLGGLATTRLIASLLYGVSATDALAFAGGALLMTAVGLAACYLPARRAARVDPMVALRYE